MKLRFDANQPYQLDAIAAVVDLFDGQPQGAPLFFVIRMGGFGELYAGHERTENGIGNRLLLEADKQRANTRTLQTRNDIEVPDAAAIAVTAGDV